MYMWYNIYTQMHDHSALSTLRRDSILTKALHSHEYVQHIIAKCQVHLHT